MVFASAFPRGGNQKVPACPQHPSFSPPSDEAGSLPKAWWFVSLIVRVAPHPFVDMLAANSNEASWQKSPVKYFL